MTNDVLDDDLSTINQPPLTQGGAVTDYKEERERLEDIDVVAALREIDGAETVTWKVFRQGHENPDMNGFVCDIPSEMLSTEHVARRCGPGKYKVIGRYANGSYAAQRTVSIAGDVHRPGIVNAAAPSSSLTMEEWERRQEVRDERRRRERNELFAIVVPAMAPIVAAMLGRQGPDLTALVAALKPPDLMTQMAALKELTGGGQPAVSPLDAALQLLDVIQDKAPSGSETNWADILKEAVKSPAIASIVGGLASRATLAPPSASTPSLTVPVLAPRPAPSLAAPSVASPTAFDAADAGTNGDPRMFAMLKLLPWLKQQMGMALEKAFKGSDPGLIAERILDDLPDGVDPQQLAQFIAREDWFHHLQSFDSRVTAHAEWFNEMREAMLEQFRGSGAFESPAMTVTPIAATAPAEPERPAGLPPLGVAHE